MIKNVIINKTFKLNFMSKALDIFFTIAIVVLGASVITVALIARDTAIDYPWMTLFVLATIALPLLVMVAPMIVEGGQSLSVLLSCGYAVYAVVTGMKFSFTAIAHTPIQQLLFIVYLVCIGYACVMLTAFGFIFYGINREFKLQNPTVNAMNANF